MDNINYYRLLSIFLDFNMNNSTSLIYKILTLLSNSSALSPRVQKYFFNSTARLNLVGPEEKISRENEILARFVDWIERGKGLCRKRVALSLANLKIFSITDIDGPIAGAAVHSRQIYRAPENITSRTSCVRNHHHSHQPRGYRDPLSISARYPSSNREPPSSSRHFEVCPLFAPRLIIVRDPLVDIIL